MAASDLINYSWSIDDLNKTQSQIRFIWVMLTHLFPMHSFPAPENIRKPQGFVMFSGGRERVHWEQMG